MGDFQYENLVDPNLLTVPDDPAAQGSSFDEMYAFEIPGPDFTDAPQADATFDFDRFEFDPHAIQGVDGGFVLPTTPQSSFPDQRYVPLLPQSQTHPSSVWRPLEQPVQQFHYPDPEVLSRSTPYYPPRSVPSSRVMTQYNFGAITPPGQQFSSIDGSLFSHGNTDLPPGAAGMFQYTPIPPYTDDRAFNPEDLALSDIPEDLVAAAIRDEWALPGNHNTQQDLLPDNLFIPDTGNDSDSDGEYRPRSSSATTKRIRRSRPSSKPKTILPNGEVKKGRPCAKPQTADRRRINERRMEGYYRRKYEKGNLEKARQQSKESYWRRKQRRIEAGEKVRSYNAPHGNGRRRG